MESRVRVSHPVIGAGLEVEVAVLVEISGPGQVLLEVAATDGGRVHRIEGIDTAVSERGIGRDRRQAALRARGTDDLARALTIMRLPPDPVLGSRRIAELTMIAVLDGEGRRTHTEVVTVEAVPAARLRQRTDDPEVVLEWRILMISALLEEAQLRRDAYDVEGARSVVRGLLEALEHPTLRDTSDPRVRNLRDAAAELRASLEPRPLQSEDGQVPRDQPRAPRRRRRS